MAATYDCDVLIAGGGPAGSVLSALLARAGVKTVMLEAEHFPRHHIGESLVPAVMPVLKECGVLETMPESGDGRSLNFAPLTVLEPPHPSGVRFQGDFTPEQQLVAVLTDGF